LIDKVLDSHEVDGTLNNADQTAIAGKVAEAISFSKSVTLIRTRGTQQLFIAIADDEEWADENVSKWSVCSVKSHNSATTMPKFSCHDMRCIKRNQSKVLCCHERTIWKSEFFGTNFHHQSKKKVTERPNHSQEESATSNSDSSCEEEELQEADTKYTPAVKSMVGYEYDFNTHAFKPGPNCSANRLPIVQSPECVEWEYKRLDGWNVHWGPNRKIEKRLDFIKGVDCVPNQTQCDTCQSELEAHEDDKEQLTFIECCINRGMILRVMKIKKCSNNECNTVIRWDPDSECIHSFFNGRIGGKIVLSFVL
jgi:hypothetical protein